MEKKITVSVRIKNSSYQRAKLIAYYTPGLTLGEFVETAMDLYSKEFPEYADKKVHLKKGPR